MRDRLTGTLEKADLALGSCHDVVDTKFLEPLIEAVKAVRTRLAYPEEVMVVALAGGTGSGKSSLLNALAGEEVVDVGGIRPTTASPAAAVPVGARDSVAGYLDRLGVDERHVYDGSGICLIDLPDMDSVEVEHRHRVDQLLPLVDVVMWVTDPEKYRDRRLHKDYLGPLSEYSAQFVFVMNQIDRLTPSQAEEVYHDLEVALESDGISSATVIPVAAAPTSGPPIGIELIVATLDEMRQEPATLYDKLLTDLAGAARMLQQRAGTGLDFDDRASDAAGVAAEHLAAGDSPGAVTRLTGLLDALASQSGPRTGEKLEELAADVAAHVKRIEAELAGDRQPVRRGWFGRRAKMPTEPDPDQARALISEAVIRPARAILAPRALAVASIAELAVDVEKLRNEWSV